MTGHMKTVLAIIFIGAIVMIGPALGGVVAEIVFPLKWEMTMWYVWFMTSSCLIGFLLMMTGVLIHEWPDWLDDLVDNIVWWRICHTPKWLLDWNLRRMGYDPDTMGKEINVMMDNIQAMADKLLVDIYADQALALIDEDAKVDGEQVISNRARDAWMETEQ